MNNCVKIIIVNSKTYLHVISIPLTIAFSVWGIHTYILYFMDSIVKVDRFFLSELSLYIVYMLLHVLLVLKLVMKTM